MRHTKESDQMLITRINSVNFIETGVVVMLLFLRLDINQDAAHDAAHLTPTQL